jgi:hypothetical protein
MACNSLSYTPFLFISYLLFQKKSTNLPHFFDLGWCMFEKAQKQISWSLPMPLVRIEYRFLKDV